MLHSNTTISSPNEVSSSRRQHTGLGSITSTVQNSYRHAETAIIVQPARSVEFLENCHECYRRTLTEHAWHVTTTSRVPRPAYVELSSGRRLGRCCLHRSHYRAVARILDAGVLLHSSGSIVQKRASQVTAGGRCRAATRFSRSRHTSEVDVQKSLVPGQTLGGGVSERGWA